MNKGRSPSNSSINRAIWGERPAASVLGESRVRRIIEAVSCLGKGLMLDVACGPGTVGAEVRALGWTVVGVELVPSLANLAARSLDAVAVADAGEGHLPFASSCVDAVLAGEIIEHVVDTDGFLQEIRRVLRPSGTLILTTPNLASFENRLRLLLGMYPIWVDFRAGGEGHVRAYTPRALKRQLAERGYVVRSQTGNWVPVIPQRFLDDQRAPWLGRTGPWAPNFAMDIIVVAERCDQD